LTPQDLLQFWFHPARQAHWFKSTRELDHEIGARFGALWQRGRDGELARWEASPEGSLALVILLDQFPLNMFRGRPESFASEASSRAVAARAIERGFDQTLDDQGKAFLYMPFMHSETLADQERSLALLAAAGLDANLKWARHHRDIVRRFGRFPHRNAILGRLHTPAEKEWLASPEAFHG
jgi:uncharacterized protein (DUF924 family)